MFLRYFNNVIESRVIENGWIGYSHYDTIYVNIINYVVMLDDDLV